jgi:low temperature requirement protein LtrA
MFFIDSIKNINFFVVLETQFVSILLFKFMKIFISFFKLYLDEFSKIQTKKYFYNKKCILTIYIYIYNYIIIRIILENYSNNSFKKQKPKK